MPSSNESAICKRKVRFKNDPAAQAALNKINPTRKSNKPTRAYKCPVCAGWHLTT